MKRPCEIAIDRYIDWIEVVRPSVKTVTIALTPNYVRRRLGVPKDSWPMYRDRRIECTGKGRR